MKDFQTYISNGIHSIGCTGQSVYVFDKTGNEIAKFKDLIYAYYAMISPNGKFFVVKSSEGCIAVYSLETLSLIKKFRFSMAPSDEGFCFSQDGTEFYNIESHRNADTPKTAVAVYDTSDFSLKKRILDDNTRLYLSMLEMCDDEIYILGSKKPSEDREDIEDSKYFVGKLTNDELDSITISDREYWYYYEYLDFKLKGFAKKESRSLSSLFKFYVSKSEESLNVFEYREPDVDL